MSTKPMNCDDMIEEFDLEDWHCCKCKCDIGKEGDLCEVKGTLDNGWTYVVCCEIESLLRFKGVINEST